MSYAIKLQVEAIADVQYAFEWYEHQKTGLGNEFLSELEICFDKLTEHPQYYTSINQYFKRIKLNRFPYIIVYELEGNEVIINAVYHTSRKPRT